MMHRPKKKWMLAETWATSSTSEVAQNAFLECGAIGMEVDDGLGPEGQKKYPDNQVKILAYFEQDPDLEHHVEEQFATFFKNCGFEIPSIVWKEFLEEDWQAQFVKSCTTFKVKPDIYIVPSFEIEAFKKNPLGPLYIEMDPENAFGTGQHQTTQLCLEDLYAYLNQVKTPVKQALDVGTGSGILAILMKKLKVETVLATETDDDALITAAKNARVNGVAINFSHVDEAFVYASLHYDLIVANILAPVLIAMASNLTGALLPGGFLILSGILDEQADAVIAAYQACGVSFIANNTKDHWCSLTFKN